MAERVSVSDTIMRQLATDRKKSDWPGETAGIVVDPSTGDIYVLVTGQRVWRSDPKHDGSIGEPT